MLMKSMSLKKDSAIKAALVVVCALVISVVLYAGLVRNDAEPVPSSSVSLDFSALPDGDLPGDFADGAPATNSNDHVPPASRMRIVDGAMTFAPTEPGTVAGYLSTPDLLSPVTGMRAKWVFRPGKGTMGAIALVVSKGIKADQFPPLTPPISIHLVVTPVNWNLAVQNPSQDQGLQYVGQGFLKAELETDGKTEYDVGVRIDQGTATIDLPDGTSATVKDPRISQWRGNFATFEIFANHGSTDANGAFREIWAASGDS